MLATSFRDDMSRLIRAFLAPMRRLHFIISFIRRRIFFIYAVRRSASKSHTTVLQQESTTIYWLFSDALKAAHAAAFAILIILCYNL